MTELKLGSSSSDLKPLGSEDGSPVSPSHRGNDGSGGTLSNGAKQDDRHIAPTPPPPTPAATAVAVVHVDQSQTHSNLSQPIKKREKFKDNNGRRIRDAQGYRLRAAGLCTRKSGSEMELLLVSGRGNHNQWVLPGGGIEEAENSQDAAIREVHEEAGVKGCIQSLVGEFRDDERLSRTIVYVLNVVEICDDWEDGRHGRLRCWMGIPEALSKIKVSQRVMIESYIAA